MATQSRGGHEKEHWRCPAVCHPRTLYDHPQREGFAGVVRSVIVGARDPLVARRTPGCNYGHVERRTTKNSDLIQYRILKERRDIDVSRTYYTVKYIVLSTQAARSSGSTRVGGGPRSQTPPWAIPLMDTRKVWKTFRNVLPSMRTPLPLKKILIAPLCRSLSWNYVVGYSNCVSYFNQLFRSHCCFKRLRQRDLANQACADWWINK